MTSERKKPAQGEGPAAVEAASEPVPNKTVV